MLACACVWSHHHSFPSPVQRCVRKKYGHKKKLLVFCRVFGHGVGDRTWCFLRSCEENVTVKTSSVCSFPWSFSVSSSGVSIAHAKVVYQMVFLQFRARRRYKRMTFQHLRETRACRCCKTGQPCFPSQAKKVPCRTALRRLGSFVTLQRASPRCSAKRDCNCHRLPCRARPRSSHF